MSRVLKVKQPGIFGTKHVIEYDCLAIDLQDKKLGDDAVEELLVQLMEGEFRRVKVIYLVSYAAAPRVIVVACCARMTRPRQNGNNLSDVSVERIAQVLRTNSTVMTLWLVSHHATAQLFA